MIYFIKVCTNEWFYNLKMTAGSSVADDLRGSPIEDPSSGIMHKRKKEKKKR